MTVNAIVAQAQNGAIGLNDGLPWRISNELKHFKATTDNGILLVGSKTWASMSGINLGTRKVIVVTSNATALNRQIGKSSPSNVTYTNDLYGTLYYYAKYSSETLWVIGGKSIYEQAVPYIEKLVLTTVHCQPEADTYLDILPLMDNITSEGEVDYYKEIDPIPDWSVSTFRVRAFQCPKINILSIDEITRALPDFQLKDRIEKAIEPYRYRALEVEVSRLLGKMCLIRSSSPHWYNYLNNAIRIDLPDRHRKSVLDALHRNLELLPDNHGLGVDVWVFNLGVGGKARKRPFKYHRLSITNYEDNEYQYLVFPDGVKTLTVTDLKECLSQTTWQYPIKVLNLPVHMHPVVKQALINLGINNTIIFK